MVDQLLMCWGEKKVPAVTSVTNERKEPGQQEVTESSRSFPSTEKSNVDRNQHAVPEKEKKKIPCMQRDTFE